ncbi:hypothetical protein BACFIN_06318 [Bacteroides finegoldii DSM 17565]|nr:hypothetical protein BACFIN_06318 [Bacteroides finegoldii DSM 17565]
MFAYFPYYLVYYFPSTSFYILKLISCLNKLISYFNKLISYFNKLISYFSPQDIKNIHIFRYLCASI